jgi:ABC-type transporter Mla maintaining outer membrane lipid asymmetry ATPase subunit MlaF
VNWWSGDWWFVIGDSPVVELRGVAKDYRGLRPLRIQQFELRQGQSVALLGFDQITAEVFVNLVTGATRPDNGDVRVFGQSTADISDGDAWLASLDRFGILSERAVLLDQLTVAQNLAVPFSLELDPIPDAVLRDVVRLAAEVGLEERDLKQPVAAVSAAARLRVRLARAVALNPRVLLAEHPNASLAADDVPAFAADFARVVAARGLAAVTLTADRTFAAAVAEHVLTLQPATGEWKAAAGWRRWFGGE